MKRNTYKGNTRRVLSSEQVRKQEPSGDLSSITPIKKESINLRKINQRPKKFEMSHELKGFLEILKKRKKFYQLTALRKLLGLEGVVLNWLKKWKVR